MKLSSSIQKSANLISTLSVIVLCLTGIIFLQRQRLQPQQATLTKAEYLREEETEKLKLNLLKNFPSFGFDNLIANWTYLRFIQYFGDGDARDKTGYSLSGDYFQAVVDRDPRFVNANLRLASTTSIFGGDPQKSVTLLGQSLKSVFPGIVSSPYPPYYLWIYKAVDEMLYLGDTEAARTSYKMAAQWAETYDEPASQATAARIRETAQFLAKKPQSKVARIGAWTTVLSTASDEKTIQKAINEIRALGGEIIISPDGRLSVQVPEE
jgi:hypothetical protein